MMSEIEEIQQELQDLNIQYYKCEMLYNLSSFYKLSGFTKLDIVKKYVNPTIDKLIEKKQINGVDLNVNKDDIYEYYRRKQWDYITKIRNFYNGDFKYKNDYKKNSKIAISQIIEEVENEISKNELKSKGKYNINLIRLNDLRIKIESGYCLNIAYDS